MMNKRSRYSEMFYSLEKKRQTAWIPFVMLGYPDLKTSVSFIETFINNGADALEIGIPFSDPVADGVLIQEAARVALAAGVSVNDCFKALAELRKEYSEIPIGLLVYANLVYRPGIEHFYKNCNKAGIDSVLIADVPFCESQPFITASVNSDVDAVFIAPPNATDLTLGSLSELNCGYTYVVSRAGVTGDKNVVEYPEKVLNSLLETNAPAPVLGFGISQPEHVRQAVFYGFKGVICGSAITRIISNRLTKEKNDPIEIIHQDLKSFSLEMKAATQLDNK